MIIRRLLPSVLLFVIYLSTTFFCELNAQKIKFVKQKLPEEIKSINDIKVEGNTIWLATGQGLFRYKNKRAVRYYDETKPEKLMINTIEVDSEDNIWVSNYAGNLLKFKKGKIIKEINFIGLIDNRSDILTDIEINKDKTQNNNEILVTSSSGMILYYNPVLDQIGVKRSPVNDMIYSIHYGIKDIVWLCTVDGLFTKYKDKKWKNKQDMYHGYGVVQSGDNFWAIGRNKNKEAVFMLYYISGNKNQGKKSVWKEFNLSKLANKYIRFYDIGVLNDELVWIASNEGLIQYNPLNGNLEKYSKENTDDFDLKEVKHIAVQNKKTVWVSSGGSNLYKLVIK